MARALKRCWWCGHQAEVDTGLPESGGLVKDSDTSWICTDNDACGQRALANRWGDGPLAPGQRAEMGLTRVNIRDGWAAEYTRKSFSVQVDEQDYAKWLEEAGCSPGRTGEIPLKIKFRIMRCMAAEWVLTDLAAYHLNRGEADEAQQVEAQAKDVTAELDNWAGALKQKFG